MAKKTKSTGSKPDENKNKPWISNYPPLKEWLDKHEAHCMWQQLMGERPTDPDEAYEWTPRAYIECWLFPKSRRLAIIVVHADRHGWEIYTPKDTNKIVATLEDAEMRLGLNEEQVNALSKAEHQKWLDMCGVLVNQGAVSEDDLGRPVIEELENTPGLRVLKNIRRLVGAAVDLALASGKGWRE